MGMMRSAVIIVHGCAFYIIVTFSIISYILHGAIINVNGLYYDPIASQQLPVVNVFH